MMTPTKFDWAEADRMSPSPEQEREIWAREECERRDIDPDEICADGGVTAWMVVAKEDRSYPSMVLRDALQYLHGQSADLTSGGIRNSALRRSIIAAISAQEA